MQAPPVISTAPIPTPSAPDLPQPVAVTRTGDLIQPARPVGGFMRPRVIVTGPTGVTDPAWLFEPSVC